VVQDTKPKQCRYSNNVRPEASRHFRNKKKEYLKAKIEELETNTKIKNIRELYRDINDFKIVYRPETNIVKNEKDDFVTNTLFWLGGGNKPLNFSVYLGIVILCRYTYSRATSP